jgi:hypothetical protein
MQHYKDKIRKKYLYWETIHNRLLEPQRKGFFWHIFRQYTQTIYTEVPLVAGPPLLKHCYFQQLSFLRYREIKWFSDHGWLMNLYQ